VDKPRGPTSHDVVAQARRVYGTRTVGHAGTLDPTATGVLVLLFGEATKLASVLSSRTKRYSATVRFGSSTDTLDAEGQVLEARELGADWLDPQRLDAALAAERARTEQQPPAYSALKVDGRPAHRRSRAGEMVELAPRPVRVSELVLVESSAEALVVELLVSKGYYVRALARDLGARLGVPAHLAALRRLASGGFTLSEAAAWPPVSPPRLIPVATAACRELESICLSSEGQRRARQGQELGPLDFTTAPEACHASAERRSLPVAWLDADGALVALGEQRTADRFAVVRGFWL